MEEIRMRGMTVEQYMQELQNQNEGGEDDLDDQYGD